MHGLSRGKVVVITGAARGIGAALANSFHAVGANVVELDLSWVLDESLDEQRLRLECDITNDSQIEKALTATIDRFGTVDVLINNAAMRQRDLYPETGTSLVLDTTNEHWERMFSVNTIGTLKVIRSFAAPMINKQRGSIINVSANGSLTIDLGDGLHAGNHPHIRNQPYDASKAALTSMSFYLAEELMNVNVAVNVVFPGATRTTGSDEMNDRRTQIGLGMELMDAAHLVPIMHFLATQDAMSVTGRAFEATKWMGNQKGTGASYGRSI